MAFGNSDLLWQRSHAILNQIGFAGGTASHSAGWWWQPMEKEVSILLDRKGH